MLQACVSDQEMHVAYDNPNTQAFTDPAVVCLRRGVNSRTAGWHGMTVAASTALGCDKTDKQRTIAYGQSCRHDLVTEHISAWTMSPTGKSQALLRAAICLCCMQ